MKSRCEFLAVPRLDHAFLVLLFFAAIQLCANAAFAQAASSAPPPEGALGSTDFYVKLFAAAATGLAALFGLPIVIMTYKKTRIEIAKLELESAALRQKQPEQVGGTKTGEGGTQILVDRSPNTNVQVLADPRFLAPLLILLDFVLAWIVLTLADRLLDIFGLGVVTELVLAVVAFVLLVPIAREVFRVSVVLRSNGSQDDLAKFRSRVRNTVYVIYGLLTLSALASGGLILIFMRRPLDSTLAYVCWFLVAFGTILALAAPAVKKRTDLYFAF